MDHSVLLRRTPDAIRTLVDTLRKDGPTLDEDIAEYHAYMDIVSERSEMTPSGARLSTWMREMCAMAIGPFAMVAADIADLDVPIEAVSAMLLRLGTRQGLLARSVVYAAHPLSKQQFLDESMAPEKDAYFKELEAYVRVDTTIAGHPFRVVLRAATCTSMMDVRPDEPQAIVTSFRIPAEQE